MTVAYTTGIVDPIVLTVRGGAGEDMTELVKARFDFRPEAIVERLGLRRPLYAASATFGMFGRDGLPWEEPLV